MAIGDFVPSIWSARFQENLNKALVWGNVFGRNHDAEVDASGNVAKVPVFSKEFTIGSYTEDTDITAPETADGSVVDVSLDKKKYFNFQVDDVRAVQSQPDLIDKSMERAAYGMASQIDTDLKDSISVVSTNQVADISDTIATAWGTKFIQAVASVKRQMLNVGVPVENRWMVVAPDVIYGLDLYFIARASDSIYVPATAEDSLRNGFRGNLLGFQMYVTPTPFTREVSSSTVKHVVLGQGTGNQAFVNQITEVENYRLEKRFADGVKGLNVYGSKTIADTQLWDIGHADAT